MFTVGGAVSVICVESVMPASIARPFAVASRTRTGAQVAHKLERDGNQLPDARSFGSRYLEIAFRHRLAGLLNQCKFR